VPPIRGKHKPAGVSTSRVRRARETRVGETQRGSAPLLEPPGFLLRNYGPQAPLATIIAHIAYGAILGGFVSLAS
jgi:hypothetical protein